MGYTQSILVSSAVDEAMRLRLLQSTEARWPFLRRPRNRSLCTDRLILALPELTDYLFDDDATYEARLAENDKVKEELSTWSSEFPEPTYVYVEADCFGGTCLYSGYACRAGEVVARHEPNRGVHTLLLRHVGIETYGAFPPFTRGYFEGRCSGLPK
jgi:hypothetical protein